MDDFQGLLARDFGLRPQGKAAPMSAARSSGPSGSAWASTRSASASAAPSYDDLFGPEASAPPPTKPAPSPSASFDSIFDSYKEPSPAAPPPKPKHSSMPVYDKPVYDDDIFDGVPGIKSSSARYEDVFGGSQGHAPPPAFDDLLGGFGKKSQGREEAEEKRKPKPAAASTGFDDLIPGFGGRSSPRQRETVGAKEKKVSMSTSKPTASMASDPFVVLETTSSSAHSFTDPLDELGKPAKHQGKSQESTGTDSSLFEDPSTFNQTSKSEPLFTSKVDNVPKDRNDSSRARDSNPVQSFPNRNSAQQPSVEDFENIFHKSQSARYSDVHVDIGTEKYNGNGVNDQSPRSDESEDDIWLTVSEIPLFTQPTNAPPPSRPPPPLAIKQKQHGLKSKRKDDEYLRRSRKNYDHQRSSSNKAGVSSVDELEDFAMGKSQNAHAFNEEEFERSTAAAASAAALKEAMDKAEAKFKHAKEVRERERDAKLRNREHQEQDNEARSYAQDREDKERKERLEQEREMRQKEEKEREQRRLEEERELERQRERERARQAVERATKEARERAAAEARAKAEREARQRAERAAVQRAQQEARERAAVEAKERAERATAEAKERAAAEAKEKATSQARDRAAAERAAVERAQQEARKRAERAAVERAAAEARERQAAEARERQAAAAAAAAAREKQSKPDDLESFFGMGARANSAPKQRAPTVDSMFDAQTQNRGTSTSASVKKASSTTNIADDLSAIFGGVPTSSDEFQEIDGESEERRRARLERHQRTRERAAKAVAEKNERDMQQQREQAERHRIAETLDFEIKRWAAGKEGNLRALLSTLQYVLWPECGWQPVSLTDLITAAAVKKVYRKATLCIHPDKVQQKGANLQQKYIAEKVFDLLKEAWNKINSEELF
ncbi:LOW QUALITY PROTEIN: auxilin-related protein 1-like [Panicum virgatum]|uniref:LOW QUALITY PROTEIN: auxilin-related protein 1-like n=1 Tax=Panicum virgatum TaxID=38727 RepID=UPI0019D576A0|nr:LOW QUALITY PROTEIN: auxilin-related protein 1-like [Panicum virgatum]